MDFGINSNMDTSFQELKAKQVVNTVDGKCLGHITDIVFDVATARALGFLVPEPNRGFWGMFRGNKDIFIPFDCVCKFGVDVILVELYVDEKGSMKCDDPKPCVDNRQHPQYRQENKC